MDKLDEVVSSERRDPEEFLEPLTGSPYRNLRIGGYRVCCRLHHEAKTLRVESVRKREGASKGDDD
ncbi:type II toxin-antitoxin system RelE family toxin [Halosimplex carlsbadense]|nr:hypothetical protein [Halosimplex carlsbadense]